jgi:hypothetical protein
MPASVGTVWVDVRFNVGDVGRQLQAAIAQASRTAVPGAGGPGGDLERGVTSSFARIGAAAAQTGRQMTFAVSAPLALIGKSAVSAFAAFDSEMTKINALVGVSRSQTTGWAEDVKNLSRQYGIAADASAGALYFITSSGIEGSKAIETLEVATKGAAVGLGDVQTVADATTSAMNAYGQENMSAAKAADILTVAVREGKGEADQMAGALSAVIPIASAVGHDPDGHVGRRGGHPVACPAQHPSGHAPHLAEGAQAVHGPRLRDGAQQADHRGPDPDVAADIGGVR